MSLADLFARIWKLYELFERLSTSTSYKLCYLDSGAVGCWYVSNCQIRLNIQFYA